MDKVVIIKSFVKNQPNWSGKEFSKYPAKIYFSFDDAVQALSAYWFCQGAIEHNGADQRCVRIIHLSEERKNKLLSAGKIRL